MSRKTQAAYLAVFKYIDQHVIQLRGVASFTTDYEVAMRNALQKLDPQANKFACYFHFCQACNCFICYFVSLGIFFLLRSIYYRLLCLPLLPAEHIKSCFRKLRREAEEVNWDIFRSFFEYFNRQWIIKVRSSLLLYTEKDIIFTLYCKLFCI